MNEHEYASLEGWWSNLKWRQQEAAMARPASYPMPEWMVLSLKKAGIGISETRVDTLLIVPPWYALPQTVDEFLGYQRRQRMPLSA